MECVHFFPYPLVLWPLFKSYDTFSLWGEDGDDDNDVITMMIMISLSCTKYYQLSHSVMSNSLQPHGLQHARLPCPSPTPGACSNSCPLVGDAIQPSWILCVPFSSSFNLPRPQGPFQWVSSSHQLAKVLKLQRQHWSFQWIFRTDFL